MNNVIERPCIIDVSDIFGNISGMLQEKRSIPFRNNYIMKTIEERLFQMKTQEIISELMEIMSFIQEIEKFWFENSETIDQIHEILEHLRSGDRNYRYTKIVHILTKYLGGIREFVSTTNTKGVLFYKKLFESTLVAIMQEIDALEETV